MSPQKLHSVSTRSEQLPSELRIFYFALSDMYFYTSSDTLIAYIAIAAPTPQEAILHVNVLFDGVTDGDSPWVFFQEKLEDFAAKCKALGVTPVPYSFPTPK